MERPVIDALVEAIADRVVGASRPSFPTSPLPVSCLPS